MYYFKVCPKSLGLIGHRVGVCDVVGRDVRWSGWHGRVPFLSLSAVRLPTIRKQVVLLLFTYSIPFVPYCIVVGYIPYVVVSTRKCSELSTKKILGLLNDFQTS